MKNVRRALVLPILAVLSGCGAPIDPNQAMISFYGMNGWSDTVTFELYDLVSSRGLRDVRLRSSEEIRIETCADENGRANIRYRREGIAAAGQPWTRLENLSPNQQILMR